MTSRLEGPPSTSIRLRSWTRRSCGSPYPMTPALSRGPRTRANATTVDAGGNRRGGRTVKDWASVEPDVYALVGSHRFTKGRARPIDRIIIHHNAANNWSTEQVRDLWNNSREASAHYQVESSGRI